MANASALSHRCMVALALRRESGREVDPFTAHPSSPSLSLLFAPVESVFILPRRLQWRVTHQQLLSLTDFQAHVNEVILKNRRSRREENPSPQ